MSLGRAIDQAIAVMAPTWARSRALARVQFDSLRQFEAGQSHRLSGAKRAPSQGPNTYGQILREPTRRQARQLYRKNAYARGAVNAIVANLIGRGIRPRAQVMMLRGSKPNEFLNDKLEALWSEWAEKADRSGTQSIYEIQQIVMRELILCGEVLVRKGISRDKERKIPLSLEVVPSERLADIDRQRSKKETEIVQGVEFDEEGKVVAYHLYPFDPTDSRGVVGFSLKDAERVPAADIFHICDRREAGAVRGMTRFTTVADQFEALSQYLNFELSKARVASAFALMITTEAGVGPAFPLPGDSETEDALGNEEGYIEGGMIFRGRPGEGIQAASPSIQSTAFDPFVKLCLRGIAVGLDISYELLARDLTQVTYLSARQGENQNRRAWEPDQDHLNRRFNCPVWREFVAAADLAGQISLPEGPIERFCGVDFIRPGELWIDPQKDLAADIEGLKAGILSPVEVIMKRGGDPDKVLQDLATFKETAEELNLELGIFETKQPVAAPQPVAVGAGNGKAQDD